MGTKRETNENVRIGDIFRQDFRDECGSSCSFYQVVGLRGRTLVELRAIRGERFLDESCDPGLGRVRVRPLPGQFLPDREPITVRAAGEVEGQQYLCERSPMLRNCPDLYAKVQEEERGSLSGYEGFYAPDQMKKEGKLPR